MRSQWVQRFGKQQRSQECISKGLGWDPEQLGPTKRLGGSA